MMRSLLCMIAGLVVAGATACDTSNDSNIPGPGPVDSTNPVMGAITGVAEGATVSGSVAMSAAATDNIAVVSVTLTVDGTEEAASTSGTFDHSWDTTGVANGAHVLVFTARDAAGNSASITFNVTVDNGGGGGGGTASVSGIVFMPNGTDPVSGALVYVPNPAAPSAVGDPPSEPYHAFVYSGADGTFSLSGLPTGNQIVKIVKGAFIRNISVNLLDGENALSGAQTTLPATTGGGDSVGKMLVVTGNYDAIENVLAKLGMGTVSAGGGLELGTETFDLADGNGSLPDADYEDFDAFIADPNKLNEYRTIFLNCGNNFEEEFFTNAAAVDALKAWVNAGGRLYCTDWSYDFCEQLFPEKIDFFSITAGDGLSSTAEVRDEAEAGADMPDIQCSVEDAALLDWLTGVSVDTTGGDILVGHWLVAWSALEAVDPAVKVWMRGDITYGFPAATANRPVTVSFEQGSGRVLFSSYHTESSPEPGLTPQDRVLQFLIFEVL